MIGSITQKNSCVFGILSPDQLLYRLTNRLDWPDFFLMVRLGLNILAEEKLCKDSCDSHHILSHGYRAVLFRVGADIELTF